MRQLVLIKHAMPEIVPAIPSNQWRLSAGGRAACDKLASHVAVYAPAQIISSSEHKAIETAQLVARVLEVPALQTSGLHEHDRSSAPYQSAAAFEASVARFFAEPDALVYGSETADAARSRFSAGIADVVRQHPAGNLVVVAHGTVITLFVAQTNQIDAFDFWQRLGLPSYTVLSLPDFRLMKVAATIAD